MLSYKACSDSHGQDSSYFLGWQEYQKNSYHQIHNPNGIVQMGLAENQVSFIFSHRDLELKPLSRSQISVAELLLKKSK